MGICRSATYWYWTMSTTRSEEAYTGQIFDQEEEKQFIEERILTKTRTARVCMTCQHFNYRQDLNYITLQFCYFQWRLIPHGEHLTSHCYLWKQRPEKGIGCCLKAA